MLDDKLLEIADSLIDKVNDKDWDEYSDPKYVLERWMEYV